MDKKKENIMFFTSLILFLALILGILVYLGVFDSDNKYNEDYFKCLGEIDEKCGGYNNEFTNLINELNQLDVINSSEHRLLVDVQLMCYQKCSENCEYKYLG